MSIFEDDDHLRKKLKNKSENLREKHTEARKGLPIKEGSSPSDEVSKPICPDRRCEEHPRGKVRDVPAPPDDSTTALTIVELPRHLHACTA